MKDLHIPTRLSEVYIILGLILVIGTSSMSFQNITGNLSCYQCLENFHKKTWYPYTDCQRFPHKLHQRQCGFSDRYCMVERVEWNGFVLSMERGCTDRCYWGCRHEGFGITKLHCTSCCNNANGCNTDNIGSVIRSTLGLWHVISWTYLVTFLTSTIS